MTDDSVMTFKQFCHGYVRYKDAARRIVRGNIKGDMKWKRDADNFMNAVAESFFVRHGIAENALFKSQPAAEVPVTVEEGFGNGIHEVVGISFPLHVTCDSLTDNSSGCIFISDIAVAELLEGHYRIIGHEQSSNF